MNGYVRAEYDPERAGFASYRVFSPKRASVRMTRLSRELSRFAVNATMVPDSGK
jgi:hypothetical protein